MTESTTDLIDTSRCPICGQSNACSQAAGLGPDAPCWCQNMDFTADLLNAIPPNQRGLSCVCAQCAQSAALNSPNQQADR